MMVVEVLVVGEVLQAVGEGEDQVPPFLFFGWLCLPEFASIPVHSLHTGSTLTVSWLVQLDFHWWPHSHQILAPLSAGI